MGNYKWESAVPAVPAQQEPSIEIGELIRAAVTSAIFLALAGAGVSLGLWGEVWWELVLGLALVPVVVLGVGLVAVLMRGLLLSLVDRAAQDEDQGDEPEKVRLIPLRTSRLIDGLDERDLAFFVSTAVSIRDWSQRAWRGRLLPSGRKVDNDLHQQLVAVLTKTEIVKDYGPRSSGVLAIRDPEEALALLGLTESDLN